MSEYGSSANAIDGAIEKALREKRLVGAVVLVAQGGEIVYRRAAGMADREAGKPMACNTLFRLASVSKPIVSTAALALRKLRPSDSCAVMRSAWAAKPRCSRAR